MDKVGGLKASSRDTLDLPSESSQGTSLSLLGRCMWGAALHRDSLISCSQKSVSVIF
jgi:hypothetical protein